MGFVCGLKYGNPEVISEWDGFVEWLHERLQYPTDHSWADELSNRYSATDDAVALAELSDLFAEYRGEAGIRNA